MNGNIPPNTSISTFPAELKQSIFCVECNNIDISEGSVICKLSESINATVNVRIISCNQIIIALSK